jgi:hypothetical protein
MKRLFSIETSIFIIGSLRKLIYALLSGGDGLLRDSGENAGRRKIHTAFQRASPQQALFPVFSATAH